VRTAVITGGAGGLGRALAADLQARGWHAALIDLPGPELEAAAGPSASLHPCDLTDAEAVKRCCAEIRVARPSIDLVIYNAGVTLIAPFTGMTTEAHRKVFEINYFGAVAVAAEVLQDVRKARGTHLAISSVAGFSPLYHRTAYAGSKHALEGFFNSLRSEEEPHGVRVQIAAPSFVATNIGRAATDEDGIGRPGAAADGVDYITPEDAAAIILKGLDGGRPMIPVGRVARLAWLIQRLSPRLMERLMARQMRDGTSRSA
jgi:NAD(P)-dependent dehydrogenase (short-subunit alcohol dehydrogenase family)